MTSSGKILEIKKYPDPVLRKRCAEVSKITGEEKKLIEDMLFTMYAANGLGLAAPQIGKSLRIIVVDAGDGPRVLVNPEIIEAKGQDCLTEGCLSLPDVSAPVKRATEILVECLDENGKCLEIKAHGLLARVIQHETDHLNGKLLIDYLGLINKIKLFKLKKNKLKRSE